MAAAVDQNGGEGVEVTMSLWFISPWEAARFALEAQRLIAVQFFPFASRQTNNDAKIVTSQEVASDDKNPFVTREANPNTGCSADVAIPPRPRKTVQARTAAARKSTEVIRKATRKANGKRKSNTNRKPRLTAH
jgi:hypothetical protein